VRKKIDSVCLQQRRSSVQHALRVAGDLSRGGKDTGMSGHSAHYPGVLVIDLAADNPLAKRPVVLRGRDHRLPGLRWTEADRLQAQGRKDLACRKLVERCACQFLQGFTQQDEAYIAVLGAASRIGLERRLHGLTNQFLALGRSFKQTYVTRQPRRMGEQHAQRDVFFARVAVAEPGQQIH